MRNEKFILLTIALSIKSQFFIDSAAHNSCDIPSHTFMFNISGTCLKVVRDTEGHFSNYQQGMLGRKLNSFSPDYKLSNDTEFV